MQRPQTLSLGIAQQLEIFISRLSTKSKTCHEGKSCFATQGNVQNRGCAFFPPLSFFYSCSFCSIVCHSSVFVKHYVTRKTACCMACRCLKVIVHSCNKLIVSVTVYFTLPHLFTINIWTLNGIKNNCLFFCPHLSRV